MIIKTKAEDRKAFGAGLFKILRNFTGENYGDVDDFGMPGHSCIDHSTLIVRSLPIPKFIRDDAEIRANFQRIHLEVRQLFGKV